MPRSIHAAQGSAVTGWMSRLVRNWSARRSRSATATSQPGGRVSQRPWRTCRRVKVLACSVSPWALARSAAPPGGSKGRLTDALLLGWACLERGGLRRAGRVLAHLGQALVDLVAALAERLDHRAVDAAHVRHPVVDWAPRDADPAGQLDAEDGLVEVP